MKLKLVIIILLSFIVNKNVSFAQSYSLNIVAKDGVSDPNFNLICDYGQAFSEKYNITVPNFYISGVGPVWIPGNIIFYTNPSDISGSTFSSTEIPEGKNTSEYPIIVGLDSYISHNVGVIYCSYVVSADIKHKYGVSSIPTLTLKIYINVRDLNNVWKIGGVSQSSNNLTFAKDEYSNSDITCSIVDDNYKDDLYDITYKYKKTGSSEFQDFPSENFKPGSYDLQATFTPKQGIDGYDHFHEFTSTATLKVTVDPEGEFNNNSFVFGSSVGNDNDIYFTVSNKSDINDLEYSYTICSLDGSNEVSAEDFIPEVGNYLIKCTVSDKNGYMTTKTFEEEIEITPKNLTLNGNLLVNNTKVYDNTVAVVTKNNLPYQLTNGVVSGFPVYVNSFDAIYNDSHVSTADKISFSNFELVTTNGVSTQNYVLTVNPIDASISPADLEVTFNNYEGVYGETSVLGSAIKATVAPKNSSIPAEQVTGTWEFTEASVNKTGVALTAGDHNIVATYKSSNSDFKDASSSASSVNILPKKLTVSGDYLTLSKPYDGNTSVTSDISKCVLSGIYGSDEVYVSSISASYESSEVNTDIKITSDFSLAGSDKSNYYIDAVESKGDIVPARATGSFNNNTAMYSAKLGSEIFYTVNVSGITIEPEFTYFINGTEFESGDYLPFGEFSLVVNVHDKLGHVEDFQGFENVVITPYIINSFDKENAQTNFELSKEYDGTTSVRLKNSTSQDDYKFTSEVLNFANAMGDDVKLTYSPYYNEPDVDKASSILVNLGISGNDANKYNFQDGFITTDAFSTNASITPLPTFITFNGAELVYGNSEIGKQVKASVNTLDIVSGATVEGTFQYFDGNKLLTDKVHAGQYTLRAEFTPTSKNYQSSSAEAVFTITKRDLDISNHGLTLDKIYDANKDVAWNGNDVVFTNVVVGDVVAINNITASYDSPNVGDRTISAHYELYNQSDILKDYNFNSDRTFDGHILIGECGSISWNFNFYYCLELNNLLGGNDLNNINSSLSGNFADRYTRKYFIDDQEVTEPSGFVPTNNKLKVVYTTTDPNLQPTCAQENTICVKKFELEGVFIIGDEEYGRATYGTDANSYHFAINNLSEVPAGAELEYTYYIDGVACSASDFPIRLPWYTKSVGIKITDKAGLVEDFTILKEPVNIKPHIIYLPYFTYFERDKMYDGTTDVIITGAYDISNEIFPGDKVSVNTVGEYKYNTGNRDFRDIVFNHTLVGDDAGGYLLDPTSHTSGGIINPLRPTVNFQDYIVVYGNSVFGTDFVPTNSAVVNGNTISLEGEYSYSVTPKGGNKIILSDGEHLDVGEYNVVVWFYPSDRLGGNVEENASSSNFTIIVQPKELTAGTVVISNKIYDGNKNINEAQINIPKLEGLVYNDQVTVKCKDHPSYPSEQMGDYEIPISLILNGTAKDNYILKNTEQIPKSSIVGFDFVYNMEPDVNGIYQLTYGTSILGKDLKVINELTENQKVSYYISNIPKTNEMLVPPSSSYWSVVVQLEEFGYVVKKETIKVAVAKLQLLVSEPDIYHVKIFDGNNEVKLRGSNSVLTNAVEGDDVYISDQKQLYDNSQIGVNKTITVSFTVKGLDFTTKYIAPTDVVYDDGVITNEKIVVDAIAHVGDGACPGDDVTFTFNITSGVPTKYSIQFNDDAKQIGFTDVVQQPLSVNFGPASVSFPVPLNASNNLIVAKLILEDDATNTTISTLKFQVNYGSEVIVDKFNDVIAIDNSSYNFYNYQWYKNGEVVDGATKQFFNDLPCLYGWYSCRITTVDGNTVKVCPVYFDKRSLAKVAARSVKVFPNPAYDMQEVTIQLVGFNDDDYQNTTIYIYNSLGSLIKTLTNITELNHVNFPKGSYAGVVVIDNSKFSFKLIVRD